MNYKVLTVLLLLVMGGIWLIDAPPTPKPSPVATSETGAPGTPATSQKWHAAKDLSIVTWLGTYRVPRGAEVVKLSDSEVEYQGRKYPIAKGDLMTGERAKELSLRPPLPPDVVQKIAMIDAEIQELQTEMQALARATQQGVGTGKGKVKNYSLGRKPSSVEVNAQYERQISALMNERQRLMTSR